MSSAFCRHLMRLRGEILCSGLPIDISLGQKQTKETNKKRGHAKERSSKNARALSRQ